MKISCKLAITRLNTPVVRFGKLISSGSSISLVLRAVFFIYVSLQKFKVPLPINLGLLEIPELTIRFYDDVSQKNSTAQQKLKYYMMAFILRRLPYFFCVLKYNQTFLKKTIQ